MNDEVPPGDHVRLHALVGGRVQGVGFRVWVSRHAVSLGLAGSALNLPDGRVAVDVEGAREACDSLLSALRGGNAPGMVVSVEVDWSEVRGTAHGFRTG